jgi:hypothetical protein
MELSQSKDIFPAISGIAKAVRETMGWEYVAGLWKENLISDLVWRVEKPHLADDCKEWGAPTFPWASIISKSTERERSFISYECNRFLRKALDETNKIWRADLYASTVETKCDSTGIDLTGQLNSGFIVLRGTLLVKTLRREALRESWKWMIAPIGKEPSSNSHVYKDFDFDDEDLGLNDGDLVYCIRLIGTSKYVNTGAREYLLHLVLREVIDAEPSSPGGYEAAIYKRIALMEDTRDEEEIQLEDRAEESGIMRDVLVKIV